MLKRFLIILFSILFFLTSFSKSFASENAIVHVFTANGCPHCAKEKIFLEKLKDKYPQLEIREYEITQNQENLEYLKKVGSELKVDVSGVPFTVIGEHYFAGYLSDETTGVKIEEAITCAVNEGCEDLVLKITSSKDNLKEKQKTINKDLLQVPIFGAIDLQTVSLPLLTITIGLLDGFNPCAMWALLFLIALLLGMKNRKRMWLLGSTFIITSGVVYFLFLSAWLNFFLFLGFIIWVRLIIGIVAIGSGAYYLRDYFKNKDAACKVTASKRRQKIFEKIKNITHENKFILAFFGIILLAFAVNLLELICSAGLPAIYTNILSMSKLSLWQYYSYLLLYIFFFILDDLIVFFIAMTTLRIVGIETKYARYSHLIGGILILAIGILLLFKPEWLMFG